MEIMVTITQEQLEQLGYFKRMFEASADEIENLCNSEKDDIVYGFKLGKIHSHLRECFLGMMELENKIIVEKSPEIQMPPTRGTY